MSGKTVLSILMVFSFLAFFGGRPTQTSLLMIFLLSLIAVCCAFMWKVPQRVTTPAAQLHTYRTCF